MAGMYADYEYYSRTYFGRDIAPEDWPRAARMADAFIDKLTFNRLRVGWEVTDAAVSYTRMRCGMRAVPSLTKCVRRRNIPPPPVQRRWG